MANKVYLVPYKSGTLVGRRKFYFFMAKMNTKDLTILGDLLAAEKNRLGHR